MPGPGTLAQADLKPSVECRRLDAPRNPTLVDRPNRRP